MNSDCRLLHAMIHQEAQQPTMSMVRHKVKWASALEDLHDVEFMIDMCVCVCVYKSETETLFHVDEEEDDDDGDYALKLYLTAQDFDF